MTIESARAHALDMTVVQPETVGFSSQRIEQLHALMQQALDKKQIAGGVLLLARHGKVIEHRSYGASDMATGAPMTNDAIFRAYSMTKPVTGVAMMILYEQGKWQPSDPISKFVPEFAHLKVFEGFDASGKMILAEPEHAPIMRELMTHTAGFTFSDDDTPVGRIYMEQNVSHSNTLKEMIDKLALIPLAYHPGTRWVYSNSMDIQGYIIEKLTGQSLSDFMRDQIFAPLGMKDAGFYVPAEKSSRLAALYEEDGRGGLQPDTTNGLGFGCFFTPPTMPSGGGGMVSTAEDYYRFAQMLLNGGELDGARILMPSSVKLMTSNHLAPNLLTGEFRLGPHVMRPGVGYGYNCGVVYDPAEANLPDGKGEFFWNGVGGTWFWVDPTNDVVFVGMIQKLFVGEPNLEFLSRDLVYNALVDPSR